MEQLSYWCTWGTQNWVVDYAKEQWQPGKLAFLGDQGATQARSMMNEEVLFGEDGFLKLYPQIRGELFFMLDDGWDVPYGAGDTISHKVFGSLELNEERFPSIRGTPQERLKEMNNRIKAAGWKGLGIWIAAQRAADDYEEPFGDVDYEYWRARILWSKFAGIRYWKVDWGTQTHNHKYRRFLTETARLLYPELVIEHATCMRPVNGQMEDILQGGIGRFSDDKEICTLAEGMAEYSQVLRTYDYLDALSVSTTLDRVAYLLPLASGYLNTEDELYLGAALGCQLGIMRSKYGIGGETENSRLDEPVAVVRWQKIAPPFSGTVTQKSEEILVDDYTFGDRETWFSPLNGGKVHQGAPAIIARNTQMPAVNGEIKPFVVASQHPNGAYAVCVLPRTAGRCRSYVGGDILCKITEKTEKIAVFGEANYFGFSLAKPRAISRIIAQSLLDDVQEDITNLVEMTEDGLGVQ